MEQVATLLAMGNVVDIFVGVLLPILVIVAMGAGIQRVWPMDVPTMARLNIYLFVPAFLFVRVSESELAWTQIGGIALAVLIPMFLVGGGLWTILRWRRIEPSAMAAMVVGGVIFNAGNFGIPVAELMYMSGGLRFPGMQSGSDGVAVQALVVMMSNVSIWLIGYVVLAMAKGEKLGGAVLGYLKLPMLYVLAAALAARETGIRLPVWMDYPVRSVALAVVPMSLVTLGAQLAYRARWPNLRLIGPVLLAKMFVLPAVTVGVVYMLGMWPWPGAQLVIASAAPTAVNTLLITLQVDGDSDLAADCVFWTTVVSAVTATGVIAAVSFAALG